MNLLNWRFNRWMLILFVASLVWGWTAPHGHAMVADPGPRIAHVNPRHPSDVRERLRHFNCVWDHGQWICPQRHP